MAVFCKPFTRTPATHERGGMKPSDHRRAKGGKGTTIKIMTHNGKHSIKHTK